MNTLLLAPEMFAAEGGIARILRLYLKALCEIAGASGNVRLVALNDRELPEERLRDCTTKALVAAEACARGKARFVRTALRHARASEHAICGHIGQLPVAWLCRSLNPRLHYHVVAHGIEVWRPLSAFERFSLRRARQVWCVSDYTRRELLRRVDLPAERAVVVPNALEPKLAPVDPGESPPGSGLLTVSRLNHSDRYKGIDQLIRALPMIQRFVPDATLRIVGDGDDRRRLERLVASSDLGNTVTFLGGLDDASLRREFAQSRVFVLPSSGEGFGLVFLEAMAHGKPCIGLNAGGVPEVIAPESGILCPEGDGPALAWACVSALQRPWDHHAIRARAAEFSYEAFRERLRPLLTA